MNLLKFRNELLIFQLIARICVGEFIMNRTSVESSDVIKASVKLMKSCYGPQGHAIGLAGNTPDSLIVPLSSEPIIPIILLENTRNSVISDPVSRTSRYKLQTFMITSSTSTDLQTTLADIKNSRWWNHLAHFYIINYPVKEYGCSRAYKALSTAWKMNLLEAKFMCTRKTKGVLIYSFNPYTKYAPKPWEFVKMYSGDNDHPWALLVQEYREDLDICGRMNFDKTKDLGGYEIRIAMSDIMSYVRVDPNKTGFDSILGPTGDIMRSILRSLNATAKVMVLGKDNSLDFVDDKGISNGLVVDAINGTSDILFFERNQLETSELMSTYPHSHTGLSIMTQYRGHKSQLEKIISVTDVTSRICICLASVVTALFLKYFARQNPTTALLNIIRMISNSSLTNLPNNVASRIYLTALFVFIGTIQAIHQGKLSSLLANQEPLKNVNKIADLANSNYKIYGNKRYASYFADPVFEGRFIAMEDYDCTDTVLKDSYAACVIPRDYAISKAAPYKLYLSNDVITTLHCSFIIREDWPLEQKMNIMLQGHVEANVFEYSYNKILEEPLRTIRATTGTGKQRIRKIFTLDDLSFAFVILAIGLGLAVISFFVEIGIQRGRAWYGKSEIHLPNQLQTINRRISFRLMDKVRRGPAGRPDTRIRRIRSVKRNQ